MDDAVLQGEFPNFVDILAGGVEGDGDICGGNGRCRININTTAIAIGTVAANGAVTDKELIAACPNAAAFICGLIVGNGRLRDSRWSGKYERAI